MMLNGDRARDNDDRWGECDFPVNYRNDAGVMLQIVKGGVVHSTSNQHLKTINVIIVWFSLFCFKGALCNFFTGL